MKIKGEKFETIKRAVTALVESMGGAAKVKEFYNKTLGMAAATSVGSVTSVENRMLWDLWATAERSLLYDDKHPCFANGRWIRVCPQVPNWSRILWADNVNDIHILTALRVIGNELGLL